MPRATSQPYQVTRLDTPEDFLNAIRERHQLTSDYQLSKLLAISHQAITRYRKGVGGFDEAICAKVAELLQLAPEFVMATMAAHRARSDAARTAWQRLAKRAAACLLFACGLSSIPPPAAAGAAPGTPGAPAVYYVKFARGRRELRRLAGALAHHFLPIHRRLA